MTRVIVPLEDPENVQLRVGVVLLEIYQLLIQIYVFFFGLSAG